MSGGFVGHVLLIFNNLLKDMLCVIRLYLSNSRVIEGERIGANEIKPVS